MHQLCKHIYPFLIAVSGIVLLLPDPVNAQDKIHASPNIVMIVIDDLNNYIGAMGHSVAKTPHIDRLAKEGVLFTRAQCPAPLCGPSRAAVLTGLRPSTTGIYGMIDDEKIKDVNEQTRSTVFLHDYFKNAGYYLMGIGKIFHHHAPEGLFHESGGASGYGPKPQTRFHWNRKGTETDWGAFPLADNQMPDDAAVNWTIDRLNRTYEKPFFLTVGLIRPHVPWYVPQKWFDLYDTASLPLPPYLPGDRKDLPSIAERIDDWPMMPTTEWARTSGQWRNMLQAYLACISYTDHNVGRILDALRKSPYFQNTIVLLWSDHGYRMGEKNRFAKMALWEQATRAPLIVSGPGIPPEMKINIPVELLSIYPTLTEICGLKPNKKNEAPSLVPLFSGKKQKWQPALTTWGRQNHALRTDAFTYIRYENGEEELYDTRKDPNEWYNLAKIDAYKRQINRMKRYLPKQNSNWAADASYNTNDYFRDQKSNQ